jgi:F0F1-type ATP synthase membrane subunit b/b'
MKTLILPFIHFAALIAFIAYKTKSPFGTFIRSRHSDIVAGLNKAKLQAAEASARKSEIEAKLKALESEKQKISAEWKEREQAQILALQESTQRVLKQARADAELNKKSLIEGFRSEVARALAILVAKRAEEKLKASMTADLQQKVNSNFIKELMGA